MQCRVYVRGRYVKWGVVVLHSAHDEIGWHDATIAGCEYLLGVEMGLRGAGKELLPESLDATPPLKALTVWLRSSILEGAVVADKPHDGVDVMAVEGGAASNDMARPQPVLTA